MVVSILLIKDECYDILYRSCPPLPPKVKTHDFKKGYRILYFFKDSPKVNWRLLTFNTSQTNNHNKAIHGITLFGCSYISYYLFFLHHKSDQTISTTNWLRARNFKKNWQLIVCTWRHSGHVGGKEKMHFSLGTKLYFHLNFLRKNSIVLTPNMAALSPGCKPRIFISFIFQNIFYVQDRQYRLFTHVAFLYLPTYIFVFNWHFKPI